MDGTDLPVLDVEDACRTLLRSYVRLLLAPPVTTAELTTSPDVLGVYSRK